MNSRQRYKAKRAAEHRERMQYCQKLERAFARLSESCSNRVLSATSLCSLRDKQEPESTGSMCLPEVALFAAGHRKSKQVTAR
ncbi:transcriptional antitermination N peptide [Klebsiella quasipneumoniae]